MSLLFGVFGVFLLATMIGELLYSAIIFILKSLPYYLLCRKTGYRNSWLAFLPYGRDFIGFIIPKREYNMLIFKTEKRQIPFWIWVAFDLLIYLISISLPLILMVVMIGGDTGYMDVDNSTINTMSSIISVLAYGIAGIRYVVKSIFHWRKDYDLLKTYGMDNHAIWAPTVNIICPLVMYIFTFILLSYSPEYGEGGYYYDEEEDDNYDYYEE